jgi:hypothetical protein
LTGAGNFLLELTKVSEQGTDKEQILFVIENQGRIEIMLELA